MKRPCLIKKTKDYWEIRTPYNEAFLEEFKEKIPLPFRVWAAEDKYWKVFGKAYQRLTLVICEAYFSVMTEEEQTNDDAHYSNSHHYSTLHLLPSAPKELIRAAWICLAKLYHPDYGGDQEAMKLINRAYEELK